MAAEALKIDQNDGIRTTSAGWGEIREKTIAAHEAPALFELVADIASTDSDDHEDFETQDGVPVSAYGSPLSLWEMKTGRYSDTGNGKRGLWSRIKWGVITQVAEENGFEVDRPEGVYIHPAIDFMSSRVDMRGSDDNFVTWFPIIAFNVAGTMTDSWRNAVGDYCAPEYVHLQAQHHMACTGAATCVVVALFGGVKARYFVIERDDEMISILEETVQAFWSNVEEDKRPSQASGARDLQVLQRLCSKIDPETEIVDKRQDEEFCALITELETLTKAKGKTEKRMKEIKAILAAQMDGVGSAIISDTQQYSWIHTPAREVEAYTTKPGAYLRTKKLSAQAAGTKIQDLAG